MIWHDKICWKIILKFATFVKKRKHCDIVHMMLCNFYLCQFVHEIKLSWILLSNCFLINITITHAMFVSWYAIVIQKWRCIFQQQKLLIRSNLRNYYLKKKNFDLKFRSKWCQTKFRFLSTIINRQFVIIWK